MSSRQPSAARTGKDRPEPIQTSSSSGGSGPKCHSVGPRCPRHHGICTHEFATARPSRTTSMNFASGKHASRNPARGHPVNLWRNTGEESRSAGLSTNSCMRCRSHGVASSAVRSRTGSTRTGPTSRDTAR